VHTHAAWKGKDCSCILLSADARYHNSGRKGALESELSFRIQDL